MTVTVNLQNIGSTSSIEPLALQPGAASTSDALPSTVGVFLSRRPRLTAGAFKLGEISAPEVTQNSLVQLTQTFTLPQQPRRFPGNGGTLFVIFRANEAKGIQEADRTNNVSKAVPVQIAVGLPDLFAIALDVPPVMQPGDTIQPNIKIANFGTANPSIQGTFDVDLVASTDKNFGPGDTILSKFTVSSLAPLSTVPSFDTVLGNVNITDPANVLTLQGAPVTLPTSATGYFLGVIVDPDNRIREIHEVGQGPSSALSPVVQVGPPIPGLPPAGVVSSPAPAGNVFPFPAFGTLQSLLHPENTPTTSG
jgi:hypothetical protein